MSAHKTFITNRHGLKLCILHRPVEGATKLAFIEHGFSGSKDQKHIKRMAKAFKDKGYMTILFDTTHALGESDGDTEHASATSYVEDLEDVIEWATEQPWYREPFALAGHSLGAFACLIYAAKNPEKVSCIAPTSTVVSGETRHADFAKHDPKGYEDLRKEGVIEEASYSFPGLTRRRSWAMMEDIMQYDCLEMADAYTMPVLLVVGAQDFATSPEHQKALYDKLPGPKELHIMEECEHTFRTPEQLDQLEKIVSDWLDTF